MAEATDTERPASLRHQPALADTRPPAPQLPIEYAHALALSREMLAAAQAGHWDQIRALRLRVPAMAQSLARSWQRLAEQDGSAARQLERARISAIREIIAVDNEIRRLQDPRLAATGDLIQTRRPQSPAGPANPAGRRESLNSR